MLHIVGMIAGVLLFGIIVGGLLGYWLGKKDGQEEEAKKWKKADDWEKKKAVSYE